MSTNEAHARIRINSMIESAGFKLTNSSVDDAFVRLEGAICDELMKSRLRKAGKRPDYHFYGPRSSKPIAFLEAKKMGIKLDDALDQATEYAKVAYANESPPMVVFASDGIQVRSRHADGSDLTLNNYPVNYIPPLDVMQELVQSPSASQGEVIDSVNSLIDIFSEAADSMRRDGIDAGINQLREFCVLLFIKIMAERGNRPAQQNWGKISRASGKGLIDIYKKVLQGYRDEYGEIFSGSEINNPEILESLVDRVNPINFTNSGIDIKGEAFEFFLSKYSIGNKSALGQYFTPRHITSMMSNLLNPQPGDKILDPFCGTGGMLISCYFDIKMGLDSTSPKFDQKLEELRNSTLYGNDISNSTSGLAKMNMILLGDGQSNIERGDSFKRQEWKKYDKLITNIPFNIDAPIDKEQMLQFIEKSGLEGDDWNELCVVKCVESIKPGGSAAIVLPLTLCHADKYRKLREYIANKSNIRACIRLPEKTFVFYTTAQTAVLILDNIHRANTSEFTFVHIKADGMSQDKNREPIPENDIPKILEFATDSELEMLPGAIKMQWGGGGGGGIH